jgi:hypothetical protein
MGAIYLMGATHHLHPTATQAAESGMHTSFAIASLLILVALGILFLTRHIILNGSTTRSRV